MFLMILHWDLREAACAMQQQTQLSTNKDIQYVSTSSVAKNIAKCRASTRRLLQRMSGDMKNDALSSVKTPESQSNHRQESTTYRTRQSFTV